MRVRGQTRHWGKAALAAFLGLLGIYGSAPAESVPVDVAPPAWVAYAERVSTSFRAALEGPTEPAQRFHRFLEQRAQPDVASGVADVPVVLSIRAWFNASGKVMRIEFAPLGDAQADADLRALLLAQKVGQAPPHGMRQPISVRLSLAAQL